LGERSQALAAECRVATQLQRQADLKMAKNDLIMA